MEGALLLYFPRRTTFLVQFQLAFPASPAIGYKILIFTAIYGGKTQGLRYIWGIFQDYWVWNDRDQIKVLLRFRD